jgi:DNA-binding beta-propeller fold protein YncE
MVSSSPPTSTTALAGWRQVVSTDQPVGRTIACSSVVASAPALSTVGTSFTTGLLDPFGVAFSHDGRHVFVDSLITPAMSTTGPSSSRSPSSISVYSATPSGLTHERVGTFATGSLVGMALSPNGRVLAAANDSGASVFSVSRMVQTKFGPPTWLLGSFDSKGQGAIETEFSPDGHFVFVSLENSNEIAVFSLKRALVHGFNPGDLVGFVPLGLAPVGMTVSADGRYLYATSEAATPTGTEGTLSTIEVRMAERDPSRSVLSTVWAGCSPVRVAATGTSVYVTARGSDALVEFSAADLVTDPGSALISQVGVGESPVGLTLVDHHTTLVIADSNRFSVGGATSNLAVVSTKRNASLELLGYVSSGVFPRDMVVSPDGNSLVVSDFSSGDIEDVDLDTLPTAP